MKTEIIQRITQLNNGEIPNGYKKTEFGVFPCDWITDKKLKDLGVFGKGKGLPGDKMVSEGVPCIGYGDIYMKYNHFHFEEAKTFVDEETAAESQPIQKGTLLFTGTGETAEEIGKCVCYNGEETIYAGGDIITFLSNVVDPVFLAYQQYQDFSLRKKASFGQGHSVVHIQRDNLEKLNVAFPQSAEEQSKIAEILMKWDEAIELQEKFLFTLEAKRNAVLQSCFSKENCSNWIKLSDYVREVSSRNNIGCQNVKSVSNKNGFIDQSSQFSKQVASEDVSKYKVVTKDCIAYNPSRINVGSIAIYNEDAPGIVSPMYVVFKCVNMNPKFLLLILETARGKHEVKSYLSGSVRNSLAFDDLKSIELVVPSKEKWEDIVGVFNIIDDQYALYSNKLDYMKKQRKTLQQYLLNGIVRV